MTDYNGSGVSEPEQLRKMFLGGLSFDTTEQSIQDYFKQFGEITDCCVVRHKHGDRKPKGFGFVTFASSACVDKVIAAKKEKPHGLDGRDIDVKRALPKEDGGPKESTTKAFVGGLNPDTTEEQLRDYFSKHGTVTEVSIPKLGEGKKRGFGFVTFEDTDTVDRMIILQNHDLHGRNLEVKKAMPKGENRRGGFGERGGRGGRGNFGGGYGGRGGGGRGGFRSGRGDYGGGSYGGGGRYQQSGGSSGYGGGQGGYGGGGGYGGSSYGSSGGYGGSGYDNSSSGGYNDFGSGYGQQSSSYGPVKGGGGGGGGGYSSGRNAPYSGYSGGSSGGGYGSSSGGSYGSGGGSSGYGGGSSYGGGGYGGNRSGQNY